MTKEKQLEIDIINHLNSMENVFVFKSSYNKSKRSNLRGPTNFPYVPKGVSDILGIFHGKPIAIEVKTPQGRPSNDQISFLTLWKANGGVALMVSSIEELKDSVAAIKNKILFSEDAM